MYQNITMKSKFCHYLDSFKYHTCNINKSCDYLGSLGLFVASKGVKASTATVTNFGTCFNGSHLLGLLQNTQAVTLEKKSCFKVNVQKKEKLLFKIFPQVSLSRRNAVLSNVWPERPVSVSLACVIRK
jgi:hypothetical protein